MVKKAKQPEKTVRFWLNKIDKAKRALKDFTDQADKAQKAARDDDDRKHSFNIQWSNSTITRSAIYARRPKPDVRRRYQKPDPEEKELARLVERAIEYQIDAHDFETPSMMTVKDYVEAGLGVPRLVYDVTTESMPDPAPPGAPQTFELGLEQITSQSVTIEHVPWSQFLWEPGKSWKTVDWVAFKSFKDPKELEEEYKITLKGGKSDEEKLKADEYKDYATVWEIWHRPSRCVYVICPNYPDKPLDKYEDELKLSGFFPVPHPLMANVAHNELIPKPDYCFIESQVIELNRITDRMQKLIKSIKDVGFYDSSLSEGIGELMSKEDGALYPVTGLRAHMTAVGGSGGFDGAIITMPNERKIQVVRELTEQREQSKQQIYEILGISDIVRGASEAAETATAQQIKGQWASVRLGEKQGAVARIWREIFRMFAEVICEHFDPMQLYLMTGIQVTPRMQEMMQNDIGRSFAIDVETDSTIAQDEQQDRQQTMELIDTLVERLQILIPAVQSGSIPANFAMETLSMLISTHKHGKQLEDAIQELGPHLEQNHAAQMQQMQQQLMMLQQQLQEASAANEQLQKQAGEADMREQMRKDAETRARIEKEQAETEAQRIENRIVSSGLDVEDRVSKIEKTQAETDKIRKDTAYVGLVANG